MIITIAGQRVVFRHDARGVQELLQFIHEHGRNKFNMKQALNTVRRAMYLCCC